MFGSDELTTPHLYGVRGQPPTPPAQVVWPGLVVLASLLVFLAGEIRPVLSPRPLALVYLPPMIASLGVAIFAWLQFRRETRGWWLGLASSFFLFFVLTGEQALIETLNRSLWLGTRELPWQPWSAARLCLAVGILSAHGTPKGLLPRAGAACKGAAISIAVLATLLCPVWAALLPWQLYIPAANGLSVADSLFLVAGGLLLVVAFARTRRELAKGESFDKILYTWLLALGWSAACRAFPFGEPRTAIAVEMLVVGTASLIMCAQLIWMTASFHASSESQIAIVAAARDVLARIASLPDEETPQAFLEASTAVLGCKKSMLILTRPDGASAVVAGIHPEAPPAVKSPSELNLAPERRDGFWSGPTARAVKQRQTVVVEGVQSDVEFTQWRDIASGPAYQVSVPILYQDQCAGALMLWFPENTWRPSECVPTAQMVVEACAAILNKLRPAPLPQEEDASARKAA